MRGKKGAGRQNIGSATARARRFDTVILMEEQIHIAGSGTSSWRSSWVFDPALHRADDCVSQRRHPTGRLAISTSAARIPAASPGANLRSGRKALRSKLKRLRKLAREGLVPDDESQLDDLSRREMLPQSHQALVRHFEVVPDGPLTEFKRGALPLIEARAFSIRQNVSEFLRRDTRFHADGVADVHSVGNAVDRGHVHVEQCAKLSIDFSEPLDGTV
jgi:hypothetical protein